MESTAPIPTKQPQKRRSCCLILAICAALPVIAAVLLIGGFFISAMMIPPLKISEETTRITGPLTADGRIDFLKALEQKITPPELATDENGYRIYFRYFGDTGWNIKPEDREFYRLQVCEKLGLDPDVPPTLVFPQSPDKVLEDFYKEKGEDHQKKERWQRPWTLEEYPMLADWINEIDEPLDAFTEAIRKPVFFMPAVCYPESIHLGEPVEMYGGLYDLESLRSVVQILQARATYRIGQGNIDGAIDDKLTLHRLGRLITQRSDELLYIFGITFEKAGASIPMGTNPEHPLTKEQIQRILDGLDVLPPRTSLRDVIECDRYALLGITQAYIRDPEYLWKNTFIIGGGSGGDGTAEQQEPKQSLGERIDEFMFEFTFRLEEAIMRTCNWNVVFRRINEVYDMLQESPTEAQWRSISDTVEETLGRVLTSPGLIFWSPDERALEVVRVIFRWHKPPVGRLEWQMHGSECKENLQRLVLAILLYQLEHGKLPDGRLPDENWATQIEKYLGENPERYFSCPQYPSPEGKTRYAMVQYGDAVGGSLLLIELPESVPLGEAVVSADELAEFIRNASAAQEEFECCGSVSVINREMDMRFNSHGGTNVAFRSGGVGFLDSSTEAAEWLRLLGREEIDGEPGM